MKDSVPVQSCSNCKKRDKHGDCTRPGLCIYQDVAANGMMASKEPLAADLISENYDSLVNRDYKEVLNEIGENREREHKGREQDILDMPFSTAAELRMKAIAALLYFNVPAMSIMQVLKIARTTFYRMLQR